MPYKQVNPGTDKVTPLIDQDVADGIAGDMSRLYSALFGKLGGRAEMLSAVLAAAVPQVVAHHVKRVYP